MTGVCSGHARMHNRGLSMASADYASLNNFIPRIALPQGTDHGSLRRHLREGRRNAFAARGEQRFESSRVRRCKVDGMDEGWPMPQKMILVGSDQSWK